METFQNRDHFADLFYLFSFFFERRIIFRYTFLWKWQFMDNFNSNQWISSCRRIIHERSTYILSARISLAIVETRLDSFLSRCVLERITQRRNKMRSRHGSRDIWSNKRCRSSPLALLFSRKSLRYAPARIYCIVRSDKKDARKGMPLMTVSERWIGRMCQCAMDRSIPRNFPVLYSDRRRINAKPESRKPNLRAVRIYLSSDTCIALNFMFNKDFLYVTWF